MQLEREEKVELVYLHIILAGNCWPCDFLEKQVALLVYILMKLVNEDNDEDYLNAPRELWDEEVSMDSVNLEAGDDQPHDTTMGCQENETSALDFYINQPPSPPLEPGLLHPLELGPLCPLEPGPLHVSCTGQVFNVGHDSEPNGEEEEDKENQDPWIAVKDCWQLRWCSWQLCVISIGITKQELIPMFKRILNEWQLLVTKVV